MTLWRPIGAHDDAPHIDPLPACAASWEDALARLLGYPWAALRPWHVAQLYGVDERRVTQRADTPRVLPVYDGDAPSGYAMSAASAT